MSFSIKILILDEYGNPNSVFFLNLHWDCYASSLDANINENSRILKMFDASAFTYDKNVCFIQNATPEHTVDFFLCSHK